MSLWTNTAVSALLKPKQGDVDRAVRTAESVTALVERQTHLTLVRRALTPVYYTAADDPAELPEHWRPNPSITAVRGSDDRTAARADWPAITEFDFDGATMLYSRGGWPAITVERPDAARQFGYRRGDGYPTRNQPLPSVVVEGSAGVLEAALTEAFDVPAAAAGYSDLIGAAEDLLKIVWAMRKAGPLMSADEISTGENRLRWASRWPAHVREVLEWYSHPGHEGPGVA